MQKLSFLIDRTKISFIAKFVLKTYFDDVFFGVQLVFPEETLQQIQVFIIYDNT